MLTYYCHLLSSSPYRLIQSFFYLFLLLVHVNSTIFYFCYLFTTRPLARLPPAISSFATLTVTNCLLVILAPNQAQATAAHPLSRSLRDRHLAATCHTRPPPPLIGLATVQNEKSHPPRPGCHSPLQRLTPHASPLRPLKQESSSFGYLINPSITSTGHLFNLQPHL